MTQRTQITLERQLTMRMCVKKAIEIEEYEWSQLDAKVFLVEIYRQGMLGWLEYHLNSLEFPVRKVDFWAKIATIAKLAFEQQRQFVKRQDNFIEKVLDIAHKINVQCIVMKGPALQSTVYSQIPYARTFSDLDILLPTESALTLYSHLINNERFRCGERYLENYESWFKAGVEMSQHLIPLHDENGTVEIHHRLNQYFMTSKPNVALIFRNSYRISTKWGAMCIPDAYDMFIMICYHMFYHHCYESETRLCLHIDIIESLLYLKGKDPGNWFELLSDRINQHNMHDVVTYCIVQTYRLLSAINYSHVISSDVQSYFITEESYLKSEEIHSRFMLEETVWGYWKIPYVERLFTEKQILEREVAYAIYHKLIVKKWEHKLHSLGIYDLHPQEDGHYW